MSYNFFLKKYCFMRKLFNLLLFINCRLLLSDPLALFMSQTSYLKSIFFESQTSDLTKIYEFHVLDVRRELIVWTNLTRVRNFFFKLPKIFKIIKFKHIICNTVNARKSLRWHNLFLNFNSGNQIDTTA